MAWRRCHGGHLILGAHAAVRNDGGHVRVAHGRVHLVTMVVGHHGGAILGVEGLEVELHGIGVGHADVEELLEVVIAGRGHVLVLPVPGGRVDHGHGWRLSETARLTAHGSRLTALALALDGRPLDGGRMRLAEVRDGAGRGHVRGRGRGCRRRRRRSLLGSKWAGSGSLNYAAACSLRYDRVDGAGGCNCAGRGCSWPFSSSPSPRWHITWTV